MSSRILEIKLEPIGKFFFGREVVFGGDGTADPRRRSYLVRTADLPQQTSLLGMLRQEVLTRNNALLPPSASAEQRNRATELVGDVGFDAARTPNSFGVIRGLSPLLIGDEAGNRWQPHPLDDEVGRDGDPLRWKGTETETGSGKGGYTLENFDPKHDLSTQFASGTSKKSLEDFFTSTSQVGIKVTNRQRWRAPRPGQTEEEFNQEGMFRQTFARNGVSAYANAANDLNSGPRYHFILRVEVDDSDVQNYRPLSDTVVNMGGEKSTFKMTVFEVKEGSLDGLFVAPQYHKSIPEVPQGMSRVLLLSDTYIAKETIEKLGGFVVAKTRPFRFFTTELGKTRNFFLVNHRYDKARKQGTYDSKGRSQSRRFTLLERGGIILLPADKVTELKYLIESETAFHQIGYNYCTAL
ncbi:CRISPR-associated protein Cmr3 [Lewinella aquimaris]|uniref:CRISPR-associated protein Cmr3 n=1 Tax=Neolewinella aquimaris TaxID=1835722 RepID=A0A840E9T8_9BACT|nr:hypothetical protein [Neolewinella aquimaris]MBB4080315.1 CRISPR-associated protein Cmr3 [Neolewinella aquimaris]